MTDIRTFRLPDLGEGLPDATIVEWLIKVGDAIELDAPLISMETAKAVVEVPSPYSGVLVKVYGDDGDVIATGAPLADFEIDANATQRSEATTNEDMQSPLPPGESLPRTGSGVGVRSTTGEGTDSLRSSGSSEPSSAPIGAPSPEGRREDQGTVVGSMETSNRIVRETAVAIGGVKAVPAVRALAKKLNVDLSKVIPNGADGVVTLKDVRDAAAHQTPSPITVSASGERTGLRSALDPVSGAGLAESPTSSMTSLLPSEEVGARSAPDEGSALPKTLIEPEPSSGAIRHLLRQGEGKAEYGEATQLKGVRRNMARVMADAHVKVVLTTIFDDADIHAWRSGNDVSVRLLRAIVAACKAVPALNAWFDGDALTRTLHSHVDVGIAVDTTDGLFVPALRNADVLDAEKLRAELDKLVAQVHDRSIAPHELTGYTISLSNFGVFAGRYATPIVVPPTVAIVAAGRLRHEATPVMGGVETHRLIPLSLSFDHRAVTGGEAARFLKAMLDDLALTN